MSSKFERYKELKKRISYSYKGYAIEKIVALDLIDCVYNPNLQSYKSLVYFFQCYDLSPLRALNSHQILFSMGPYSVRKDYYEIWDYVRNKICNHLKIDFNLLNRKFHVSIVNIMISFSITKPIKKDISLKNRIILAALLTEKLNIIDAIEVINPRPLKYCAFSSVHPVEALLTLYFKKNRISTFSLQHGLYFVFKSNILIDSLAYENFISDYHIAWGQYTKDEFAGYGINPDNILVGGYPRKRNELQFPKKLNKNVCLVLLARSAFEKTNLSLISILTAYSKSSSLTVHLKLHPNLDWDYYKDIATKNKWTIVPKETTLTELFSSSTYGFGIAINTAAYYEAYMNYLPCLRYNDGSFEDSVSINDDQFDNLNELINCINKIPFESKAQLADYFSKSDSILTYTLGIGIDKYNYIISQQ